MKKNGSRAGQRVRRQGGAAAVLLLLLLAAGCGGGTTMLQPRSVVNFAGERIQADPEVMAEVEAWLRPQLDDIERNPSFLIRLLREPEPLYPWSRLQIQADTAQLALQSAIQDAETPFLVYGHLRLMESRGELERWLPGSEALEGLELERAMLERISDLWLLGRSVFDTQAHGPLDEIMYAREGGFLDEFILATQGERFAQEREAHFRDRPEREEAFREWFLRVFEAEGPRYLSAEEAVSEEPVSEDPVSEDAASEEGGEGAESGEGGASRDKP
jgi:hypothetical protein